MSQAGHVIGEVLVLRRNLAEVTRERDALRSELEQVRKLLWSVHLMGRGYTLRLPDGSTHILDPTDVTVVIDASKVPPEERLAARVLALADSLDDSVEMMGEEAATLIRDAVKEISP